MIDDYQTFDAETIALNYTSLRKPLISGLFRLGELCNIVAPPKLGKSHLALQMAFCVSHGYDFLGMQTSMSNVLYVDNELHLETISDRLKRISNDTKSDMKGINYIPMRGKIDILSTVSDHIVNEAKRTKSKLIILDALYRFLDCNENDNSGMMKIYNHLDEMSHKANASIVLIHHTSKGDQTKKSISDIGSGAGVTTRATDTHLTIREHKEGNGAISIHSIVRSFPELNPIAARKIGSIFVLDNTLDPYKLKMFGSKNDSKPIDSKNMPVPELGEPDKKEIYLTELRESTGCTKPHAELSLKRAIKDGILKSITGDRNAVFIAHPEEEDQGNQQSRAEAYIKENPKASKKEIATILGINEKTVQRAMKAQKDNLLDNYGDNLSDKAS